MCSCEQGTCPGGCACGCAHTPPIVLDLTPHEVGRALEALRGGRGYIAEKVADKLEQAAPRHVEILDETGARHG